MFANIFISRGFDKPLVFPHESRLERRLAALERHFYTFLTSQGTAKTPSSTILEKVAWPDRDTTSLIHTKNAVFNVETVDTSIAEGFLPIKTVDDTILAALEESLTNFRIVGRGLSSEPTGVNVPLVVVRQGESHVDIQETRPTEPNSATVGSPETAKGLPNTASELRKRRKANLEILEGIPVTPAINIQTPVGASKEIAELQSSFPSSTLSARVAHGVLDVIQSYGQHVFAEPKEKSSQNAWLGRSRFMARVEKCIVQDQPIKMILPAFPWKSIYRVDKVNGRLPDLGEHLALSRLNHLCEDIGKVYSRGAEMTIATDGLVFDDLVGIPDEDTWAYSESLMNIAQKAGFHGIKLRRPMDILKITENQTVTRDVYFGLAAKTRMVLEKEYGRTEEEVREMIRTDEDTLLTYRGFIRFLETDLRHSPIGKSTTSGSQYRKCVKKVAMGMMRRAESFTNLLQANCQDYVRFSIHPSKGGVKLSIPLIVQPTGEFPKTPWHCTIAVGIDGTYRTVHVKDVQDTHKLILHNGNPYYYREKSEIWDWVDGGVVFEPQYPSGVLVHPSEDANGTRTLTEVELNRLRRLAKLQSPVVVSGFTNHSAKAVSISP